MFRSILFSITCVFLLISCQVWADVIYADVDGVSTWVGAYTNLQEAIDAAEAGDEVWIAEGIYQPTDGTERTASFQMKNGVEIYGGFAGTETMRDERDWEVNETILSGDIGTEGDPNDNCYHVFYHPDGTDLDETAVLDGFTITSSRADKSFPNNSGGGMFNDGCSVTVRNCVFSDNWTDYAGGGMYNTNCNPTVSKCTFIHNSAYYYGGGMSTYLGSVTVADCVFSGNQAYFEGGGIHNDNCSGTVSECSFNGNEAEDLGGGMYNDNSDVIVSDCTFSGNSADKGGGLYNNENSPTITDCTFSGNGADEFGGGMYNYKGNASVNNCSFRGNSGSNGGGMYNFNCSAVLINCAFSGNTSSYGGGMYNFYYSNPTVSNCTFNGNSTNYGGGMYNHMSSPILTNCILWGNSAVTSGDEVYNYDTASIPQISYSDVEGCGGSGAEWINTLGSDDGNNIDEDPLFVIAAGGDLNLAVGSLCIDAGDNDAVGSEITDDLYGYPRIIDGDCDGEDIIDMGTLEFNRMGIGDLDHDCKVDQSDFSILSFYWTTEEIEADIAPSPRDHIVEMFDLIILAENWLTDERQK